jgi:adenylosuccinate synthase
LKVGENLNIYCEPIQQIYEETDGWIFNNINENEYTILHKQTNKYLNANMQLTNTPYNWLTEMNDKGKMCIYDENGNNIDIIENKLAISNIKKYTWTINNI